MPDVAYQPSMLDLAEQGPTLGPLAGAVRRHELSRGAWVDHLPGWVRGSDAVLDTLRHDVPWRAERRTMYDTAVDVPRLLCWYAAGRPLPHPVLGGGVVGVPVPIGTSCQCWLAPLRSVYWEIRAPSAVERSQTSRALLECLLIRRT